LANARDSGFDHARVDAELELARFVRGLREAHAHVLAFGKAKAALALWQCGSRAEVLGLIAARAAEMDRDTVEASQWLIAVGARPAAWAEVDKEITNHDAARHGAWPTLEEIDSASPNRPCLLMSFDHHSGIANTRGLLASGLHARSADPAGGVLVRDEAGRFTGVLLESAFGRVRGSVPEPTRAEMKAYLVDALADFAKMGFGEVHDLLTPPMVPELLHELEADGKLTQTVWMYVPLDVDAPGLGLSTKGIDIESHAARRESFESKQVRLAGGKVFADGTLNATTAWMRAPYANGLADHPCGTALVSVESLRNSLRRCWSLGIGLAVHAIGDGAVRAVVEATEAELAAGNEAWQSVREAGLPPVRIEHAEVVDAGDVPRIAALWRRIGLVVSVQPCHLLYDIEVLEKQLPDRLDRVLPLRALIDAGVTPGEGLWFGSDAPIVRPEPKDSLIAAIARRREDGSVGGSVGGGPSGAIAEEEAITLEEAVKCFGWVVSGTNAR